MDTLRYKIHAKFDNFVILLDTLELKLENAKPFCIHSKDLDDDVGMISNFSTATEAINFAESRIKEIEKSSKSMTKKEKQLADITNARLEELRLCKQANNVMLLAVGALLVLVIYLVV